MCKNCNCPNCTDKTRANRPEDIDISPHEEKSIIFTMVLKVIGFIFICMGIFTVGRAVINRVFAPGVSTGGAIYMGYETETHISTMPAYWPDLDDAFGAYLHARRHMEFFGNIPHDCDAAIYWYKRAAKMGLGSAMSALGRMFSDCTTAILSCTCSPIDFEQSVYWYRRAAEQNDSEGLVGLGIAYRDGIAVEQDYDTALRLFRLAAGWGSPGGMTNLGLSYLRGHGVEQSYTRAIYWIRRSAESWDPQGIYALGYMYEHGYGTERDIEQALYWYERIRWSNPDAAIAVTRLESY